MKFSELISRFQPYADEEVSIVMALGAVTFFPVSDGNKDIITLQPEDEEPFRAIETSV